MHWCFGWHAFAWTVPYRWTHDFPLFLFLEWHTDEVGGLGGILYGCHGTWVVVGNWVMVM